jgi:DNA-binding transcriptional ArsR family regulator
MIDITPDSLKQIQHLINLGRYQNLEQFLATAFRNQLVLENSTIGQKQSDSFPSVTDDRGIQRELDTEVSAVTIEPRASWSAAQAQTVSLPSAQPVQDPLWGQFYRFLPLKLVLRLLTSIAEIRAVSLIGFRETAIIEAVYLSDLLRSADVRRKSLGMLPLSVAFPNPKRPEKSQRRFLTQYVGLFSKQGSLTGFPSDMGFLVHPKDGDDNAIQLSGAGAEFARIPNPVLDSGDLSSPLSPEEVAFLVNYVAKVMPGEKRQMVGLLSAISRGADAPSELQKRMSEVYEPYYRTEMAAEPWSRKKVALMTSGALSRLVEMGYVLRQRDGQHVRYELSGDWESAAQVLS